MATSPVDIYETTSAQELYETSAAQMLSARPNGFHRLSAREGEAAHFLAEWKQLAAHASEPNPFFEPWFLLPSLRMLAPANDVFIGAYYAGGQLCGIIPLIRSSRYYGHPISHVSTWVHPNCFCGTPLVRKGYEAEFWLALSSDFDREPGRAIFLHLPAIARGGRVAEALEETCLQNRRLFGAVSSVDRAMLASDASPETYFEESMPNKKRKELRRQAKRLGEEGHLTFERQDNAERITEWTAEFLALEASGWKGDEGSSLSADAATCALFREALAGAAEARKLERLTMRIDGKPIAMLANFITAPGAFSFKTAFDENFARYSPGVLIQRENLELLARDDIAWCDSCAAEGHPMIERIWREKRTITSYSLAIGGTLRRTLFKPLLRRETRDRT